MSCEDANMSKIDILKDVFWKNKILSENEKEKVFYFVKSIVQGKTRGISNDGKSLKVVLLAPDGMHSLNQSSVNKASSLGLVLQ